MRVRARTDVRGRMCATGVRLDVGASVRAQVDARYALAGVGRVGRVHVERADGWIGEQARG